jgi:hypothetical protein
LAIDTQAPKGLVCRCQLDGQVIPVTPTFDATGRVINGAQEVSGPAPGLAFLVPSREFVLGREVWVRLFTEFVVDDWGNTVDGAFVQARFPTGDRRHGTSPSTIPAPIDFLDPNYLTTVDALPGMPGEHFDSWFTVQGA